MAGYVPNIKVHSPLKLHRVLLDYYHAICHYSYNLPIGAVIAYLVGIVFGLVETFEPDTITGIQDMVINSSVSVAIPILLFSTNLKSTLLLARKTIISLFIALFVVVVVGLILHVLISALFRVLILIQQSSPPRL